MLQSLDWTSAPSLEDKAKIFFLKMKGGRFCRRATVLGTGACAQPQKAHPSPPPQPRILAVGAAAVSHLFFWPLPRLFVDAPSRKTWGGSFFAWGSFTPLSFWLTHFCASAGSCFTAPL